MSDRTFRQATMAAALALSAAAVGVAGPQTDEGHGAINVRKALNAKAMTDPGWPGEWQVFGPIPPGLARLPAEKLEAMPKQIDIDGKTYAPRAMKAQDNTLDLRPLWPSARGGKDKERLACYFFAEIDCPEAGTRDERSFHLRALAAIAQTVQAKDFERRWLSARNEQALRDIMLLSRRDRRNMADGA